MPQERHLSLLNLKVSLYPAAHRGLVSSLVYVILWGICIPPKLLPWVFLYSLLWFYPFPTAAFPCGNILFSFVLFIVAPGAVYFCIPCNILSLHPLGIFSPTLLPHLFLPSILGMPFPSCHICASCISRALYCPSRLLPNIVSGRCIRLQTRTVIGNYVPTARFVSGRSPVHLIAWQLYPPLGKVVVVYLTVNLETFGIPP